VKTGEEVACTVAVIGEHQDHKRGIGVEFDEPSPAFGVSRFRPTIGLQGAMRREVILRASSRPEV